MAPADASVLAVRERELARAEAGRARLRAALAEQKLAADAEANELRRQLHSARRLLRAVEEGTDLGDTVTVERHLEGLRVELKHLTVAHADANDKELGALRDSLEAVGGGADREHHLLGEVVAGGGLWALLGPD